MEAIAAHASSCQWRAMPKRVATVGWVAWKAVSKQAICGSRGSSSLNASTTSRLTGWCSGASAM
ncbi:Uncharacterised protein [Chromobacterium violaceum]|uniref:Uncharacterized protein n=1 Tax=Chromobacterium violaceum TaxID=536 RepID=A0A3S4LNM4_CHRVL|nr:Uncharacterised protein [Chromobacterium violaceum]